MESVHAERDITPEISDFKPMTSLSPPGRTLYFVSDCADLNNAFVSMLPSFIYTHHPSGLLSYLSGSRITGWDYYFFN